ncbi:tail fiber protein [Paenibacillus sp. LHD-117]|uniref:phage tail protein n=1 Tax=Paenibacillus sp. LHD-117 TaxID=3071412 RepID=UPI0027E2115C|nr:tail fiber protein [Paenibacillus sp. LHD-117]MDQ6422916.1 tail fiber protein [Paenibacillus sp. LHD-117]
MADPFVGEIRIVGFNFAPTGWALCNGQLLPISQNTALFSLLGTFYGGDGKSTFALPNLQDSAPMHSGQGAGLSERSIGESSGTQYVTLLTSEMPAHNHAIRTGSTMTVQGNPDGAFPSTTAGRRGGLLYGPHASGVVMNPEAVSVTGSSLPHNNMQPYLGMYFIIAMQGIFPPR